ncbi:MAG: ABC transporter substrate-binding protein [Chloroflexi bacterium]|nr:ABC transporter substrate-binding protein [Chloroflexota bacterium]
MAIHPPLFAAIVLVALTAISAPACTGKPARVLVAPSATALPASGPRLVTDDLSRRVNLTGTPQRIVALSPATVEILFALGVAPVGRPTGADYPEAAKQVSLIGTIQRPNYDQIAELKPDLVVGNAEPNDPRLPQLEKLGVPVVLYNTASYTNVLRSAKTIGQIVSRESEADRAIRVVEDRLASIKAKLPQKRPTLLVLMGSGKTFYIALPNSYVGGLVKELGATNVAVGPEDKRYRGFTQCSLEKLLEKDPEVVIAIRPTNNPARAPSLLPTLAADQRWQEWKAVNDRRIYEVSPLLFLQNPGLKMGDALADLAAILYPQSFPKDGQRR